MKLSVVLALVLALVVAVSAVDVETLADRRARIAQQALAEARVGVSDECTLAVTMFTSALPNAFSMVQWHNDFGAFLFQDPAWLVSTIWYRYTGSGWEWSPYRDGPFQPVSDRTVNSGMYSTLQSWGLSDISDCNKYLMDKLQADDHPKPFKAPDTSDDEAIKTLLNSLANSKGENDAAYCIMIRDKSEIKDAKTCCKPSKTSTDAACCATTSGASTDEHAELGPTPRGMYRIYNKREHPKYHIPWYNLERYQDKKFLAYDKKGTDGRYVFGFHPGQVSHGCVTIQAESGSNGYETGEGSCWYTLETRVEQGKVDDTHKGYIFVF